jgi:hypothetical protein
MPPRIYVRRSVFDLGAFHMDEMFGWISRGIEEHLGVQGLNSVVIR